MHTIGTNPSKFFLKNKNYFEIIGLKVHHK